MLRAALQAGNAVESKQLAARLDELDKHRDVPLLNAALWYAEHGLHVFPLTPRSKQPWPRSHGCHDATTDEATIRRWWGAAPTSNIGIATGHSVDVIDIDGYAGNVSLCAMLARIEPKSVPYDDVRVCSTTSCAGSYSAHSFDACPSCGSTLSTRIERETEIDGVQSLSDQVIGQVTTPRAGGRHLYVRATGQGNGTKLAHGVDYRGRGGYVVAPPSYVVESDYEGAYKWTSPLDM